MYVALEDKAWLRQGRMLVITHSLLIPHAQASGPELWVTLRRESPGQLPPHTQGARAAKGVREGVKFFPLCYFCYNSIL